MRDTIDMAREAGFKVGPSRDGPDDVWGVRENLIRFEVIVRADALANIDPTGFMSYQEADAAGRFAEREACAVIAETPISGEQDDITMQAKDRVAAAIRARGQA
jgi:hypothetical protein